MSYPHELQVLVVEDDDASKSFYNAAFEQLVGKGYPIAPLRYAFCHADGVTALSADTIYHLVILDLRLPRSPREPPVEGLDLGLDLLQRCADRNDYPVPTVLVISGHPDKMSQGGLAERVSAAFAHGQVLIKGASLNSLEGDIENAVRRSIAYCQVGLHVRDGGTDCFPTLSPRDVDLLRRAVIMQEGCIGLDLRWWSAEFDAPFEGDATFSGWTKTLMGGFLLGRGRGKSRPTFFKLAPNAGAESVAAEARLLQHKLSHIKVFPPITAGNRSLLMTQKVGEDDGAPVALAHFLGRPAGEVGGLIANVVQDVAGQVARLGDSSPNQEAVGKLLWRHHDSDRLAVQWKRWLAPDVLESLVASLDVTRVYGALRESQQMVRFGVQSALHGDLNATNIALDVRGELARGYIFDASGVAAGVNLRDLAMLEATSMLHLPVGCSENLVRQCSGLYAVPDVVLPESCPPGVSDRAKNTWTLVTQIRRCAMNSPEATIQVYALMVFDNALIQLEGLAFSVSRNKIRAPEHAAELAARAANWLRVVSPELFAK